MTARPRKRRGGGVGFVCLVGAVAALAFYATLHWPSHLSRVSQAAPLVVMAAPALRATQEGADLSCAVAHVTDGDTLRCRDGVRIRLHAVAARETDGSCSPGHPCPSASAGAATAELRRLVSGRTIQCRPTGQSYDRVTAICWTPGGEEVNCAMVQSGTALIWDRFDRQERLCGR